MCIFFWILHVSSYHMIFIFLWLTSLCVIISRTTYVDVHRQMNGKRRWGIHTHTHTQWNIVCAKSLQSCPTLFDPMDHSQLVSSVHGILQARILEWVAFSRGSFQPTNQTLISYVSCIGRRVLYH